MEARLGHWPGDDVERRLATAIVNGGVDAALILEAITVAPADVRDVVAYSVRIARDGGVTRRAPRRDAPSFDNGPVLATWQEQRDAIAEIQAGRLERERERQARLLVPSDDGIPF